MPFRIELHDEQGNCVEAVHVDGPESDARQAVVEHAEAKNPAEVCLIDEASGRIVYKLKRRA